MVAEAPYLVAENSLGNMVASGTDLLKFLFCLQILW